MYKTISTEQTLLYYGD